MVSHDTTTFFVVLIPNFTRNLWTDSVEYSELAVHCLIYLLSLSCQVNQRKIQGMSLLVQLSTLGYLIIVPGDRNIRTPGDALLGTPSFLDVKKLGKYRKNRKIKLKNGEIEKT